ncbi:MAG: acyl-CoA desaturase [Planctomycetes bacterium]|nr:acyl-CoA desaturase [Planctomycetota bacterium]
MPSAAQPVPALTAVATPEDPSTALAEAPAAARPDAKLGREPGAPIRWLRIWPFLVLQATCLLVFVVGWSPVAVIVAVALYLVRMFGITAFYHRYFSHRTFRTGRVMQFVGACLGASAVQRGPLWWAAHHRQHHRHSDTVYDAHSPHAHGFWWSHIGWIADPRHHRTDHSQVPDLRKFPELVWLDRMDLLVPFLLLAGLLGLGAALEAWAPSLGTNALQMGVWGFSISTTVLFHATATINSLGHLFGRRVWPTRDQSRNSMLLALLTLGEGWHNNHHWAPGTVRQGFRWWEIDVSYYVLRLLAVFGLVHDLNPLPERARAHERRLPR